MINYYDTYTFYDLLGSMIFYGFNNGYSEEYIEEKISASFIFKEYLEKGDGSFLNNVSRKEIFEKTFSVDIKEENLFLNSTISLWIGEAYMRLFFKYHKSLSYIMVYFPLLKMEQMFSPYHEMDWSQLYDYFESLASKNSILSLLLKKKRITAYKLSVLSDIKLQTIKNYCRNNKNLYAASFSNIVNISSCLNVDVYMFAEKINNYVDANALYIEANKIKYLLYYGYYLVSYFSKDFLNHKFVYDENSSSLRSGDLAIRVFISEANNLSALQEELKTFKSSQIEDLSKTYLLIFTREEISNPVDLKEDFKKVFLITPSKVVLCSKTTIKEEIITSGLRSSATSLSSDKE